MIISWLKALWNNVAKPAQASWLMRLSGGLIVSQAAIKTGFGPWVKYKGPAKGTQRHVLITPLFRKRHPRFAVLAQTRMQELNWKVYVRALAGCGTLVVLSVPRLPCLERRAPHNRTEDKAATWVNAKAAKTKKNYVSVGLVQEKSVLTSTKMFNAHTFVHVGSSWGNRAILPGSQPPMTSIGRCTESADWGRGLPLPRVITERNTSMRWLADERKVLLEALGVKQCTKPWGGGGNLVPADARVRSAQKILHSVGVLFERFLPRLVFGVAPCVCQMNNSDASEFWAPVSSDALDFGSLRVLMH